MKISFIIPVYNCKSYLSPCIDSIRAANAEEYEIILVDDGSTDGSGVVCDDLAARFPEVQVVHQKNAGVSTARNRGLQMAQGQYILFLDADDTMDASAMSLCWKILLEYQPDMLIFGMSFDYYFHGKLYRRDKMVSPVVGLLPRVKWVSEMAALYACNALSPVWNKFIKKDLLKKNQILFPCGMIEMEDFWFSVRCMRYCKEIFFLPEVIYRYRQPETEDNTYRRLCRIPSLNTYMEPFEEELTWVPGGTDIAGRIYESFFYEMLRFGDTIQIRQTAEDMLGGKYAERIAASNPKLFRLLEGEKYSQVRCQSMIQKLRHALAIQVKYLRNGGKVL